MIKNKKILIMAGGTGGHIFPGLAVAEQLRAEGASVAWLGGVNGMEADIVTKHQLPLYLLSVKGLRGAGMARTLTAPWFISKALLQARAVLKRFKPDLVIGMGGYVSGPGGIAAWLEGIPLIIHEQNTVAGLTNRILARLACRVCEAFPHTFSPADKLIYTGNPIRTEITNLPAPAERFLLRENQPIQLLVLGGSRGAQKINQVVLEVLKLGLDNIQFRVLHQTGAQHFAEIADSYRSLAIKAEVVPFIDNMAHAYANADLVISRSGAITVSELAAAGVPSILIPFPFAVDDHQTTNAAYLANQGAGILLKQQDLTVDTLHKLLLGLTQDRVGLLTMATKARHLAVVNATQKIIEECQGAFRG